MKESIVLKETFKTNPTELYNAWLDSDIHSEMTGGDASCSAEIGASFSAWDGYITGHNVELIQDQKIVQKWRTSEFEEADEDSLLTIELNHLTDGRTELTLTHTNIPEGQTQYLEGWTDHYFIPMQSYFEEN